MNMNIYINIIIFLININFNYVDEYHGNYYFFSDLEISDEIFKEIDVSKNKNFIPRQFQY